VKNTTRSKAIYFNSRLREICVQLGIKNYSLKLGSSEGNKQNVISQTSWLAQQIGCLPPVGKRSQIKNLNRVGRSRLLRLMNAAVHCVIKAFIPLGDIGEAYENVATKLLASSRNSSFISNDKKTLIIDDIAKICAQFPSSNVHRRAFLAVLSKHLSFDQLQGLKNKFLLYDDDTVDAELPSISDALPRPVLTKRQISSGRKEYYVLKGGQSLKKSVDSREKKSSRAAEGSFISPKER